MDEMLPVVTTHTLRFDPEGFDHHPPLPPELNVEAWLWTPWRAVNMLPVNFEHEGQGGGYPRRFRYQYLLTALPLLSFTGNISSIHRLDGMPSNMQSAYYNCATCMRGMYNAAFMF